MPLHRFFLTDFVSIQRQSFYSLLEKGLIEEFNKRNPITNGKKDISLFFYPEYYILTRPDYNPQEAIFKNKSYTSQLFVPVQITNIKTKKMILKWVYIGNIPLMTKRGHFILNGAARVIVNQILRSPGIYYQQKIYENVFATGSTLKPEDQYKRFYADIICMRGTWLRILIDKKKNIWAQMKKGPKIPIYWFLLAMGLSEKIIFKTITDSYRLLGNLENKEKVEDNEDNENKVKKRTYPCLKTTTAALKEIYKLIQNKTVSLKKATTTLDLRESTVKDQKRESQKIINTEIENLNNSSVKDPTIKPIELTTDERPTVGTKINSAESILSKNKRNRTKNASTPAAGRKWFYNRFMNPRTYDLGKQGRFSLNKKLGLTISPNQCTLTGLDVLYATDYLIKVEKGIYKIDDIDHLKNRRVRTSGELIQMQIGVGLVRLEKSIRDLWTTQILNKTTSLADSDTLNDFSKISREKVSKKSSASIKSSGSLQSRVKPLEDTSTPKGRTGFTIEKLNKNYDANVNSRESFLPQTYYSLFNNKPFNSAIREFFGTSPLSQFMDQINPLAELTHKRRLSSMGPGGVTRDSATLAIRGIHPTHYGRICPVETPEGKNTGLVNSMTAYARVNHNGIIESPFYKVYKGIVQKNTGLYYFSAEAEEKIKLAAADIYISPIGFLPKSKIPVRIGEDFTKIYRQQVQYVGISPLQMISIATSLIPFLEHDDANRALMGSNMQRQAVPVIRPARPIVGTGLEARAISDSGHILQTQISGLITYVSAKKIVVSHL